MLFVAADHGETVLAIQVLLGAEFHALVPHIYLIDRALRSHLFNPLEQANQGSAVAFHGMTEALDLHLVLEALEVGDGGAEVYLLAGQSIGKGVAHAVRVDEDHLVLTHALQEVDNVVIVANPHAAVLEVLAHLVGHFALVDEQFLVALRDISIGDGNGCEVHVASAQVQQPCDVVESRHQHGGGVIVLEHLEQTLNFGTGFLAGILHIVYKGRFTGPCGTVSPDLVGGIELGGEHITVLAAEAFQLVGILGAVEPAVDGDDRVFLKNLQQPFVNGGIVTHVFFHHHEAAVGQFNFCLQEITGIGPQRGLVKRHDSSTVAASETADPVAEFPVVTDVFTLVGVSAGNDDGIDIQAAHLLAQRLKMRISLSTHCYISFGLVYV